MIPQAATDAYRMAANPGASAGDVWAAMWHVLEERGALGISVERMGHGLGTQLTEWSSNPPGSSTARRIYISEFSTFG